MGYKVIGTLKHNDESFEHGSSVSASKLGGEENFKALVAGGSVVTNEEFDRLYPDSDDEGTVNEPTGTPSNLREVEGTKLQANMPEPGNQKPAEKQATPAAPQNPANPPEVKGAGDSKAGGKEAEKKGNV
jgi:hypothetical protein